MPAEDVPILDALTDRDRLEFISKIPKAMHARVDKLLVEAAEVEAFRDLAKKLGVPEKAPQTNISKRVVRTYLTTSTSVDAHQVEKFVEAYRAEIMEEPLMEPIPDEAHLAGDEVPVDDEPPDDEPPGEDAPGTGRGLADA